MLKAEGFTKWLKMIKVEHTLFSLPFAFSSAFFALRFFELRGIPISLEGFAWRFFWIAIAVLAARSAGMSLNRIIDADIDAANPRTADRELVSGAITKKQAWFFSFASLLLLLFAALQLPPLCLYLSPIAFVFLWAYPYMKRISFLAHFVLGITLGGACLGAWLAITGTLSSWIPFVFALAVVFWVAGFDIIYASQDMDFDREHNLQSIPAVFGFDGAMMIARFCHFLTPLLLYVSGQLIGFGMIYKIGVLLVILALFYEQRLVKEGKIEAAFFVVNSWISVLIFVFVLLEFFLG